MKKRFLGLVLCVAMLISAIPSVALPASAVNYIFGADLFVDVPVAGLSLNKKGDVEVGVAYMNNDLVAYNDPMDIFKVESITWYEVNSSGTKKLLGEGWKGSHFRTPFYSESKVGIFFFYKRFKDSVSN